MTNIKYERENMSRNPKDMNKIIKNTMKNFIPGILIT